MNIGQEEQTFRALQNSIMIGASIGFFVWCFGVGPKISTGVGGFFVLAIFLMWWDAIRRESRTSR